MLSKKSFLGVVTIVALLLGAWTAGASSAGTPETTQPRIVLPAFVVRCDGTADVPPYRVTRPGYCVDTNGSQAVPGGDPIALEADPELRWEAFDEYWRKIHGPKIIHVDGEADTATGLLRWYDQQHRIPGGPTTAAAPVYQARTGADGLLTTDPYASVSGYSRPSFDGLAQLAFDTRQDFDRFFGVQPGDKYIEKIVPDEQVFLKGFAFNISEEYVLKAGPASRDSIVLIKLVSRPSTVDRKSFQVGLYDSRQALLHSGEDSGLVTRYSQLHNISDPADAPFYDPAGDRIDLVEVFSFRSTQDAEAYVAGADFGSMTASDASAGATTEFFTAVNYSVKAEGVEEQVTAPPTR